MAQRKKLADFFSADMPYCVAFDTSFCLQLFDERQQEQNWRRQCRSFVTTFTERRDFVDGYVSDWARNESLHVYEKRVGLRTPRTLQRADQDQMVQLMRELSNLPTQPVDRDAVLDRALQLHRTYGIGITDAWIISDAQERRITDFIGNNRDWEQIPNISLTSA
jgi:predicted nucleic acid-binding protein